MSAILWLFNTVVLLYILVLLVVLVMSWLIAFKVLDPQQPFVAQLTKGLYALTNPILNPVRRIIPSIGGLDFSPIVVILLLEFIRRLVDGLAATGASSGTGAG